MRIKHDQKNKKTLLVSIVFLLFALNVVAQQQNECLSNLEKAYTLYETGQLDEVTNLLTPCLESGSFTKEEKLDALKLLTLVNIFDDQDEKADEYMNKFLSANPEYVIKEEKDPIEFIRLYNTFNTLPILGIGINAGMNYSTINVLQRFGVNNIANNPGVYSSEYGGGSGGIYLNKYISKRLWVQVQGQYNIVVFSYKNTMFDFAGLTTREIQTWLDIPLIIGYEFLPHKRLRPYIGVGVSYQFLLSSKIDASRIYTDNALPEVQGPDIDITNHRNTNSTFLLGTIGLKYKVPRGFIGANLRFEKGLNNQTLASKRYENSELLYKYYYVDDDFVLNNITASLSYTYLLYNPRKKK